MFQRVLLQPKGKSHIHTHQVIQSDLFIPYLGHLTPSKGHLTIQKRSLWITGHTHLQHTFALRRPDHPHHFDFCQLQTQWPQKAGYRHFPLHSFSHSDLSFFLTPKSEEMVKFGDAVEPALQLYFEDCCADGLPPWIRIGKTLIVGLSLLFLLPLGLKRLVKKEPEKRLFGWWFQRFFIFIPIWGNDPIWLIFFKGLETTNQKRVVKKSLKKVVNFMVVQMPIDQNIGGWMVQM